MATTETTTIHLEAIRRAYIDIPIEGISPYLPHNWSKKAIALMEAAQSGRAAKAKREPKVPEDEAEAALYRLPNGHPGAPAAAFKAATIGAVRLFSGITMTATKCALSVLGEGPNQLVSLDGEMTMRRDMPRNATGVVDLRYRYAFWPWAASLRVEYLPAMIDEESVVCLIDAGGNGGIGDWRPSAPKSCTGTFGRYRVASL